MNRGRSGYSAAAALLVVVTICEITEAAEPGFYVGASGGRSEQRLDKQAGVGLAPLVLVADPVPAFGGFNPILRDPPNLVSPVFSVIAAVPDAISADQTDVGWNFALGYRVNKYLAAELSYVDAGDASLTQRYTTPASSPISFPDLVETYTVNACGPAVSVLGSLPLSERWEVFLRGGVLFAKQEVDLRVFADSPTAINPRPVARDFSDEVVTIGAGVQWAFLPRWTARLEYQRSDDLQPNEIMGESRLDQASLSVLFGL